MFLAVTVSLMVATHQIAWFRAKRSRAVSEADPALKLAAALLAPFAALMAARIGAGMFGAEAHWVAAAAIVAPAAVIAGCWSSIRPLLGKPQWEPSGVGLLVGALWIATEPAVGAGALGPWLAAQTPGEAAAWLALRVFGFALIAPLAEELVFRGYLHRALVKKRFEEAAPAAFSWAAFIVTSPLFGAMHGRWLAGALAGAAFAITLYRPKSLTGPVTAHIAASGDRGLGHRHR
jgi:CAAX prenyl protease-like protein